MPVKLHNVPTRINAYRIKVEGKIDPSWSESLGEVDISSRVENNGMPVSVLTSGTIDQAALRGLLIRLWDLNLSVLSVRSLDPEKCKSRKLGG